MRKTQCVSCGAIYDNVQRDGSLYFHACPADKLTTPAVVDKVTGAIVTPEVRTPIANPRNENVRPDLEYHEGKPVLVSRDPNDATRQIVQPASTFIISEGAGRAPYDEATKTAGAAIAVPTIPGKQ